MFFLHSIPHSQCAKMRPKYQIYEKETQSVPAALRRMTDPDISEIIF